MSAVLHLDFETRSEADLKKVGAHQYFEHPSTTVLCAGYSFGAEEPELWLPDDVFVPDRIIDHVKSGGIIAAWNANFERLAWRHVMTKKFGFPPVSDHQWQCTMTESLAMNMPAQLKDAAPAFGLDIVKDDIGHRLMMKMCKPRKPRKDEDPDAILWHELPADLLRLGEYCRQDVRVEHEISKRVLRLRPSEQKLYLLDMKINDRGVYIDKKLCEAAGVIVKTATARLDDEMKRVTGGVIGACTNVTQLTKWLGSREVKVESLDKASIEDLLITEIPDDCRRALELRQEGSKTSTAKIGSMLARRQSDGRMRGNLQFYGASATGRWAARGTQLQNLTRPQVLGSKDFKGTPLEDQIESAIKCIDTGSSMVVELMYGRPLTLVADCVRSMIKAPNGRILRSSDFSNIEGRAIAWEAGQEDKLEAFRAYDAGAGPDLYVVAASGIYNVGIEPALEFRTTGKTAELALGFQGGARAFAKMAKNSGVRIAKLYDGVWGNAQKEFKDQALGAWDNRGRKTGMSREGWLAAEVIKLAWRAKNYRIAAYWKEVEIAAISAVRNKGEIVQAGKVRFRKVGSFLFCMLPSGRALCYPYPRLLRMAYVEEDGERVKMSWKDALKEGRAIVGDASSVLAFKAIDQFTKQWGDTVAYGGHLVENITQAIARDIMAEAMLRVDAAGYNVILTVHDEIITEDDIDFGSMDEFNALMTEVPPWATGLPISVGGWENSRYHK